MEGKRKKIGIIGAGFVGATAAHWAVQKELGDVVLLDVNEGAAKGRALDLFQASTVDQFDSKITGTSNYSDITDADIVILTAGLPRKPGMSRDDLLATNAKIVKSCCEGIKKYAPNSVVIVVSNPLDAMCIVAKQALGFPRERVIGMAGILDSARYRAFIAEALNVSVKDVQGFTLGGHGDTMVPLPRYTFVGGVPLSELMPPDKIDAIVQRTVQGGGEIVKLLQTGSAYYAPSAAAVQMAESILKDQKRILPCAAELNGEYNMKGLFIGVLCRLGGKGLEQVVELKLNDIERAGLEKSAVAVRELAETLRKIQY